MKTLKVLSKLAAYLGYVIIAYIFLAVVLQSSKTDLFIHQAIALPVGYFIAVGICMILAVLHAFAAITAYVTEHGQSQLSLRTLSVAGCALVPFLAWSKMVGEPYQPDLYKWCLNNWAPLWGLLATLLLMGASFYLIFVLSENKRVSEEKKVSEGKRSNA